MNGKPTDFESLVGQKFARLTILEYAGRNKFGHPIVKYKCDCGSIKSTSFWSIKRGITQSCGCYLVQRRAEGNRKHGLYKHRLYKIWNSMRSRCNNEDNDHYMHYGGRGISVCDEWQQDFISFYNWSINNGHAKHLTLDRIDNDAGYGPNNCRWANTEQQANNKRMCVKITHNGETLTIAQWSRKNGIPRNTIDYRLRMGLSTDMIFSKITVRSSKVWQCDLRTGDLIREWNDTAELKKAGFSKTSITRCCRGERNMYAGFKWKYPE